VTGKALSALMATLRRGAGGAAVEYQKGDFVLRIGAAALPPPKESAAGTDVGTDVPDDDPPPRDWRFALEDLSNLNASASRGKLGSQ
jgi:hypothetical protein